MRFLHDMEDLKLIRVKGNKVSPEESRRLKGYAGALKMPQERLKAFLSEIEEGRKQWEPTI
jgi:hypothetical protein